MEELYDCVRHTPVLVMGEQNCLVFFVSFRVEELYDCVRHTAIWSWLGKIIHLILATQMCYRKCAFHISLEDEVRVKGDHSIQQHNFLSFRVPL